VLYAIFVLDLKLVKWQGATAQGTPEPRIAHAPESALVAV
jgi:hypothetical protein